jgi:hypothetical protein
MVDLSQIPPEYLASVPALQPPPGVTSNFLNPVKNRIGCRLAVYITLPMAIISLIMRIYTRARVSGGVGADDCKSSFIFYTAILMLDRLCSGVWC